MTRIDFYVLDKPTVAGHERMICRVIEKAWQHGHRIYVNCGDAAAAAAFDDALWQFQDTSFVPHARDSDHAGDVRVLIGITPDGAADPDVLVNLAADVPEAASRYARVVESAGYDDVSRSAARGRYRYYQDRGFPLHTHKVGR